MGVGIPTGDLLDQNIVGAEFGELYHTALIFLLLIIIGRLHEAELSVGSLADDVHSCV